MTDSTTPDGAAPTPNDRNEPAPASEPDDKDTPGAPTSSAPLTDSTDGGLDGGDPGVEE